MSELHIRQIRAALDKTFRSLIGVSDLASFPSDKQEAGFLTRAQAAFCLAHLADISPEDAAGSVTDGFKDNGIDATYYHPTEHVLYLVQSKWRQDGSGSVDRGEIQKFIKGFKDLINARWDRFPGRLSKRKNVIESALNDASTRIVLVVACTGQAPLSDDVRSDLKDAVDEANSPTEIVSTHTLRQGGICATVQQGLGGAPIDVEVARAYLLVGGGHYVWEEAIESLVNPRQSEMKQMIEPHFAPAHTHPFEALLNQPLTGTFH